MQPVSTSMISAGETSPASRRRYRLCVFATHPIQYQGPLWRELASDPGLEVTVYYCSDQGTSMQRLDPGFGLSYVWDIPLLEGYQYYFLRNWSPWPSVGPLGCINPRILPVLWRDRYDAILVNGWNTPSHWLAFLGAWVSRTRILIAGDTVSIYPRPWYVRLIKRMVLRPLFRTVGAFLVTGTFNRDFYIRFGVPASKLFFYPWAIDNRRFAAIAEQTRRFRGQLRSRWGVPAEIPLALFCGKLILRKRPLDLIRAALRLNGTMGVIFAGEGEMREQLEAFVRQHHLRHVVFLGFVNQAQIPAVMSACDVLCLPSREDPRGTVVNEAMACGLPVVISKGVGIWGDGDIVRHRENGFVYDIGDVEQLAACLGELAERPELRHRMGDRSRVILQTWSYAECVEGVRAALRFACPHV